MLRVRYAHRASSFGVTEVISFIYERPLNVLLLVIFPLAIDGYEDYQVNLCMN